MKEIVTRMFKDDLLKGKRILVTGGGTGLGKEMASHYAQHGAELYICGRRENVLKETSDQLSSEYGVDVHYESLDIRASEDVDGFIQRIFDDGHEIACHYNFHDDIFLSNRKEFACELDKAIESIEDAIGQKPIGFRAPNFAINKSDRWAYEEISLRFDYDSSYQTSSKKDNIKYFSDLSLKEFFIFVMPIFKGNILSFIFF